MKSKYILLLMVVMLFGCDSQNIDLSSEEDNTDNAVNAVNQVLLLQVDYTKSEFEGGKELKFLKKENDFTISHEYIEPSDFGSIKLIYKELNEPLFEGTIHWMGTGKMTYPEKLEPASKFGAVITLDYIYPGKGFEPIIIPDIFKFDEEDYLKVWRKVQYLNKTRDYIEANPNQKVKIFLYTPSVGAGDPLTWKWLIFIKK